MRTDGRELLAVGICGRGSGVGDRIELLVRRRRGFSARISVSGVAVTLAVLSGLMLGGAFVPRWIAFAQSQRPAFEVASIKLSDRADERLGFHLLPGGRLSASNVPLDVLIAFAYDVPTSQISGGPGWVDTAHYDIEARAAHAPAMQPEEELTAQYRQMVQSLLADRFKLSTHIQQKEGQIYTLSVAKGGPRLKESRNAAGLRMGIAEFDGRGTTMYQLAHGLSQRLGRPVIDATGLPGTYEFTLTFRPEGRGGWVEPGDAGAENPDAPSIFAALPEQLGLRLESGKGPVDTVSIDHVEKPDAN